MLWCFLLYPALVSVVINAAPATDADGPRVDAPVGTILGQSKHIENITVEEFHRIPYAKPPVGELRFALPQPFGPVEQKEAPKNSFWCPQPSKLGYPLPINEDCLQLSILRKAGTKQGDNKPVIAIIHGGGFSLGSGTDPFHNSIALAAFGDVVTVNINYRLGIFGFADMKDIAPGNLGLYDQRLALEWIQDNVRAFGGDPDRVTLLGVSAGSMCISAQLMTPLNRHGRKLFHAAIMDGGVVATGIVADANTSLERVKKIAKALECETEGVEMVACLRKADADALIALSFDQDGYSPIYAFLPTIDGKFIPQDASEEIRTNADHFNKVKIMIGYAKDEGTMFASYTTDFTGKNFPVLKTENAFTDWCAKLAFGLKYPIDLKSNETARTLLAEYYEKNPTRRLDAADFVKDGTFACPVNSFIRSYSKAHSYVYAYYFQRKLHQAYWLFDPETLGVMHGSPFLHMIGSLMALPPAVTNTTTNVEDRLYFLDTIRMISEFAGSDEAPRFQGLQWPAFSEAEGVMVFDEKSYITEGLYGEERCSNMFPTF